MSLGSELTTRLKRSALAPWLWETREVLRKPLAQREVYADYLRTLRETRFLREGGIAPAAGQVVLIASMSDFIHQLKCEALLGVGLMQQGFTVRVLTTSPMNVWAHRYFRAFGIHDFVYWENLELSAEERLRCRQEGDRIVAANKTFAQMKAATFEGSWVGPQILSSIARHLFKGAPDPSNPIVRAELERLVPETLGRVLKAQKLFRAVNPELMYLIEANYATMGPLVDEAIRSGVSVIQAVQPSRDDAMYFKKLTSRTRRHHPASVAPETLQRLKGEPWGQKQENELQEEFEGRYGGKWFLQSRNQPNTRSTSPEEVHLKLGTDPSKKTAVIFSHILWDANLFYGEDLFEDYEDWFTQTVRAACQNKRLNWLIKLHPANLWKRARENRTDELAELVIIREKIGGLPAHVKLLLPETEISTKSLFHLADYGITVRGTVGIELPCFGVTVLTAGTGRYSGLGFTLDSSSKEDYLRKLATLPDVSEITTGQVLLAKRHAYAAFRRRPWTIKSFKTRFNYRKTGHHPLDHNLSLTANSLDELQKNGDLSAWASWAQKRDEVDYIE